MASTLRQTHPYTYELEQTLESKCVTGLQYLRPCEHFQSTSEGPTTPGWIMLQGGGRCETEGGNIVEKSYTPAAVVALSPWCSLEGVSGILNSW